MTPEEKAIWQRGADAEEKYGCTLGSASNASAFASLSRKNMVLDERVKVLEQALVDAIWAADYLSEQQAMPDYGYQTRLESARRVMMETKS